MPLLTLPHRRLTSLVLVSASLSVLHCSRREESLDAGASAPSVTPFRLYPASAFGSRDAGQSGASVTVSTSPSEYDRDTFPIDDQGVAHISLKSTPQGGEIVVDGVPTTELALPIFPLVADEPIATLSHGSMSETGKAMRSRVATRWRQRVEIRGAGRLDEFEVKIDDLTLDAKTVRTLIQIASKLPSEGNSETAKSILLLRGQSDTVVVGREGATLSSFDWVATEEDIDRQEVRKCTYTNWDFLPLYAVSTRVVVMSRDGAVKIGEKSFPADKRGAKCLESIYIFNAGPHPTDAGVHRQDPREWLKKLAAKKG